MSARDPRTPRPGTSLSSDWRFPTPTVRTLDNGLEVWVFDLPGQHVVAADLMQPIALDVEPRQLEGVGTLALRASDEGTRNHPAGEISELLEDGGAVYSGRAGHSFTASNLDVPLTRLDEALSLFAEIILEPAYAAEDISRHQALRVAELEQAMASGSGAAALALRKLRWSSVSRSSRPAGGAIETVQAITPADVQRFHAEQWGPQGSVLVLGGAFTADPMPLVERAFGAWQPTAAERVRASEDDFAPAAGAGTVHVVDRPDAVQIDLRLGGVAVDRRDPHWADLQVASVAIGGSFLSRLNRVIREELGYTYGIHLSASPQRHAGTWTISANIRTEVAADAIAKTLELLDVTRRPLTEAEVADAANQLIGISPLRNDTAEAIVGQASLLASAGFDAEQVNRHQQRLRQVTAESATAAAAAVLDATAAHLVVVGSAEQLEAPLRAAGFEVVPAEL